MVTQLGGAYRRSGTPPSAGRRRQASPGAEARPTALRSWPHRRRPPARLASVVAQGMERIIFSGLLERDEEWFRLTKPGREMLTKRLAELGLIQG